MLMRICTFVGEMQTGTAAMKNSRAVSQNIKNRTII